MVSEWLLMPSEYGILRRRAARMHTLAGKVEGRGYKDGGKDGWLTVWAG